MSSDWLSASACPLDLGGNWVFCELGLLSAFPPPPAISKNLNGQSSVKKCTSSSPVRTGDWVYWSRKGKSPQAAAAQLPRSSLWCHLGEGPVISETQLDPCRLTLPQMTLPHSLTYSFNFFSLLLSLPIITLPVSVCVCVCMLSSTHLLTLLLFDHVITQSSLFNGF